MKTGSNKLRMSAPHSKPAEPDTDHAGAGRIKAYFYFVRMPLPYPVRDGFLFTLREVL